MTWTYEVYLNIHLPILYTYKYPSSYLITYSYPYILEHHTYSVSWGHGATLWNIYNENSQMKNDFGNRLQIENIQYELRILKFVLSKPTSITSKVVK